ncbi:tRNA (adenosine(37)-N6)-threonylcarbamoyltransferase complex dimerization subunit type 1 TsaB [Sinomonas mesophila]|uniref:tRNA (adenosine(37)-N6)-threonylcarbamoyltransferase complex dimerization subunit type 1 TsaB n=1 Tax=Sinomonas mesophila TaxID=1531955 RepID=UPI000986F4F3|nr:tRNA (adenosine(37)-N6)-threonylcarbamoyltransferase complex dimerization subunit type 1 TsaB [Sinomonas mesophila]
MIILAIDTSAIASAALIRSHETTDGDPGAPNDAAVLASFATEDTKSHAEVLAPGIRALLAEQELAPGEIERIVVGIGPGPFTGLRSGIATARALAFAWDVPLHGVMSLDALAWDVLAAGVPDDGAGAPGADGAAPPSSAPPSSVPPEFGAPEFGARDFAIATDARRKELYWARYGADGVLRDGPHVTPPGGLPAVPVYGAGAGIYPEQLADAGATCVHAFDAAQPTAASLGLVAAARIARGLPLADTTPLYLRESDAQVPGPRKRAL